MEEEEVVVVVGGLKGCGEGEGKVGDVRKLRIVFDNPPTPFRSSLPLPPSFLFGRKVDGYVYLFVLKL